MRKKINILIYPLTLMVALMILLASCNKDETYSSNDLEGVWTGDLRTVFYGGSSDGLDIVLQKKFTFGLSGSFISMEQSPIYESINGNLSVTEDGNITGSITTTHKTDSVNIETTTMNWAGSAFETESKINVDMNWPWQNTNNNSSGYYVITGSLTKQ